MTPRLRPAKLSINNTVNSEHAAPRAKINTLKGLQHKMHQLHGTGDYPARAGQANHTSNIVLKGCFNNLSKEITAPFTETPDSRRQLDQYNGPHRGPMIGSSRDIST